MCNMSFISKGENKMLFEIYTAGFINMMKKACSMHNSIPFLFTLFPIDNKRTVLAEIFNVIYPHHAERIEPIKHPIKQH
jgi:hypothetical protein